MVHGEGGFGEAWAALRQAVDALAADDYERPSGCAGWRVRDLVCHLVIDAQDVLITLATPASGPATADARTYWDIASEPPADDPLSALITRLATAYGDPELLRFHLDDVGSAAGRAAALVDPGMLVSTKDRTLTAGDYLHGYVLEWALHHLDLVEHLPDAAGPSKNTLSAARTLLEDIAGGPLPAEIPDAAALQITTGRRAPTPAESAALGSRMESLPLVLS